MFRHTLYDAGVWVLNGGEMKTPRSRGARGLELEVGNLDHGAAADDQAVEEEQDDRADNRADPAGCLLLTAKQRRREEAADEGAGNSEENGDDPATRVTAGHEELGDRANDETEQQPSNDVHASSSRLV